MFVSLSICLLYAFMYNFLTDPRLMFLRQRAMRNEAYYWNDLVELQLYVKTHFVDL